MKPLWGWVAALGSVALVSAAVLAMALRHDDRPVPRASGSAMATGPMHGASVRTEYEYLAEMVAHHREAIEAAGELRRSPRSAMRAFGARIVASQSTQVRQMTGWINAWYPARPESAPDYEPHMRDLSALRGDDLDRTFLVDMIGHHMVAVMVSRRLLVNGVASRAAVAALARDISREQRSEIVQMRRWTRDWFEERAVPVPRMGAGSPGTEGPGASGLRPLS